MSTHHALSVLASGRCVRWFLVTNGFKTAVVAIDLFADDPRTQGVAALGFVFGMIAATLCVKPYTKRESNMLETRLFVVVSAGVQRRTRFKPSRGDRLRRV